MASKPISRAQVRDVLQRAHALGLAKVSAFGGRVVGTPRIAEIASKLGMPKRSLENYLGGHCRRFGWDPRRPETWADGKSEEMPLESRERQRYADQISRLRTELREAQRGVNAAEDLRKSVFGLAEAQLDPPVWDIKFARAKGSPGVPMLLVSDLQWGEKISAAQMDGVNEFNLPIARARYKRLIEKTISLCRAHMVNPRYPGLVYKRGGDMVSGDIHQELRETNEAMSIAQVVDLVEHEVAGLEALLAAKTDDARPLFPEIWVISVPGNHGRQTMKPQSKGSVEANYDTLSAYMIESHFKAKGEGRIHFHSPASPDALFRVHGFTMLLTHGDRIGSRGGAGFIGAVATVARGMKKLIEYYAALGIIVDWIFIGHFHEYHELPWGFCNGSLPGISEFARDGRFVPRPPVQLLTFVHPQHGITARWPILLEDRPRLGASAPAFSFLKTP